MIDQNRVGYHEAGHAVVALHLGWIVSEIVRHGGQNGHTDADPQDPPAHPREDAMVTLGARAGEERYGDMDYDPRSNNLADEWEQALECCRQLVGDEAALAEAERLLDECRSILARHADVFDQIARFIGEGGRTVSLDADAVRAIWEKR